MEKETKKNTREILNIHTHNPAAGKHAIINYNLSTTCPIKRFSETTSGECPKETIVSKLAKEPLLKDHYYSVGIHPWDLLHEEATQWDIYSYMLTKEQIVAIGEAGLDKQTSTDMSLQIKTFVMQVEYAEFAEKPIIIHCVKAMEELLAIKKKWNPKQPWIWHGFRGKPKQAEQLLKQGFYLSLGENYPEETMAMIPADHLFIETDDSSVDIEILLEKAAKVRRIETDVLRETIYENVEKVFFRS